VIKNIVIDIRPVIMNQFHLYNENNGELNFKQWIKKEKKPIIQKINTTLSQLELEYQPSKIELKIEGVSTIEAVVSFMWTEDININEWTNIIKYDCSKIATYYHGKRLITYVA